MMSKFCLLDMQEATFSEKIINRKEKISSLLKKNDGIILWKFFDLPNVSITCLEDICYCYY